MTANPKFTLTDLSSAQVETLLVGLADILIKLNDAGKVVSIIDTAGITSGTETGWTGKTLAAIASPESVTKIEKLIAGEAPGDEAAPWRHINLLTTDKSNIPLLVKYFAISAGPSELRFVAGRDLRPLQQVQARFQQAAAELERRMGRRAVDRASSTGFLSVAGATHTLGSKPIDEIVKETAERVEQAFFAEAIRHANGDPERAAELLGLTTGEFLRRALLRRLN